MFILFKEPVLFSGTIKDNILYGLNVGETISESQFVEIVRKAHVDEFTSQLPDGLQTMVGQRGMMLSGGQKQRVAIARALIKVIKYNEYNLRLLNRFQWSYFL